MVNLNAMDFGKGNEWMDFGLKEINEIDYGLKEMREMKDEIWSLNLIM